MLDEVDALGALYADQGKMKEAEVMYWRALQRKELTLGPEHTSTLDTVNALVALYADQGKMKEAEAMYSDRLHLMSQMFIKAVREGNEKIVGLLLKLTRIGQDSRLIESIFLEAVGKEFEKIVELLLKFTNIGRRTQITPPIIDIAQSIAGQHTATRAILDTWQLAFEKRAYMSLDALLTDERLGIIPDWFECDWEVQEVLQMNPCYKDREFAIAKVLRSLVVLTGDRSTFEATVCEKYLKDKWGSIGLDLLDSVCCGLDSADSDGKCEFLWCFEKKAMHLTYKAY